MKKIIVLASGRGSNFIAVHQATERDEIKAKIVSLITDRYNTKASEYAIQNKIETYEINFKDFSSKESFNAKLLSVVEEINPDLILTLGYLRILEARLIQKFPSKIINIHPSLLPSFKGLHAQSQALSYGVKFTGATVHFVDEGIDTGPILSQVVVPVLDNDTEETLSKRILEKEHLLIVSTLKHICNKHD